MKKLFLILLILLSYNSYSQNTFESTWYLGDGDADIRYVIEEADGNYIMLAYRSGGLSDCILKVSANGDSLGFVNDIFPSEERLCYFGLFPHPEYDDVYIAPAIVSSPDKSTNNTIALISFDTYLAIVDIRTVSFESDVIHLAPSQIPYSLINDGKIEFAAHVRLHSGEYAHMYARIDINGNLLSLNINKNMTLYSYPACFEIIDKEQQKYGVLYNKQDEGILKHLYMIVLDSNLKIEREFKIEYTKMKYNDYGQLSEMYSLSLLGQPKLYYLDEDRILLSVLADKTCIVGSNLEKYRGTALAILDNNYEFTDINFSFSIIEDEMIRHPLLNAVDIYGNYIYECVIDNYYTPHPTYPTRCKLRKYDNELNLVWERYINEDTEGYYYPRNMMSTSDGGCIIVGHLRDKLDYNTNYLYAAKVDSEGNVSINEYKLCSNDWFLVYPNPASEMINVSFAQDVNCENVEIYSLDGRLCHSQNFNFNNINIENLSSGIYLMKITLSNGQTYSEKVVVR